MTKEEFKPLVYKMKTAFVRDGFFEDVGQIDLWYEMLRDLKPKYAAEAVDNYIRQNRYQPTIADIREEYKVIVDDIKAKTANIREIIDAQLSYYPNVDKGKETWDLIAVLLNKHGGDWAEKTRYAKVLADKIFDHVRHCEETDEPLEPDVKDYLRTLL